METTNDAFSDIINIIKNGDIEQIKNIKNLLKKDDIINAIKNNDVEYIKKILSDPYFDPKSFVVDTFTTVDDWIFCNVSLLFVSCCYKVYEIIELLLEDKRINVDNKTFNILIHNKYSDVLKIFFNNKRTYNEIKKQYNYSDIHIFCTLNDKEGLINTLEDVNNNPNLITLFGMSALQLACQYEHYDIVKLLLEHPNINLYTYDDFMSPFCQICFNGTIDIINLFLDHPALCPSKEAAISAASKSNSVNKYEIIKLLLNDGRFDPNFVSDINQVTGPLHVACIHNDNELFNLLINDCTSIDKNLKTNGVTPLMLACSYNNIHLVKRLLEFEEVDPNDALCCCNNNCIDILKLLLEHPKITVSELNKAFLFACSYDSKNVLKLLLSDNRINYNIKNAYGSTGLHYLCSNNLESGIKLLMTETDIDVTAVDIYGNTILHCLCNYNEGNNNISISISINESLKYLLGDDRTESIIRKCNDRNLTPMSYLCQNGNYEAIKIILVKYPDYDMSHIDHDECSYLMHACKSNNLDLIKFLIYEKDNDPLIISKDDENIFHIACKQMCLNIIKFLIESEFGIDFNKLNKHDATPFNHLCQSAINKEISSNELDAIKYLIDMPFIDNLTPDCKNLTPLEYFCCRNRQYSDYIIKYMLEHVENIVIPNKKFNNDNIDKILDKYRNK